MEVRLLGARIGQVFLFKVAGFLQHFANHGFSSCPIETALCYRLSIQFGG
jgi:hypothetical protein